MVVDEDCGVPTSVVESYRSCNDSGPLAQTDPRSYLLSMSEYDKSHSYNVYGKSASLMCLSVCLRTGEGAPRQTRPHPSRGGGRLEGRSCEDQADD